MVFALVSRGGVQEPRAHTVAHRLHQLSLCRSLGHFRSPTGCTGVQEPRVPPVAHRLLIDTSVMRGCGSFAPAAASFVFHRRPLPPRSTLSLAPAPSIRNALPFLFVLALEFGARASARWLPCSVLRLLCCAAAAFPWGTPPKLGGGSVAVRPDHHMAGPAPLPITVITDDIE